MDRNEIRRLEMAAVQLRRDVLDIGKKIVIHAGGSLSCADIVAALYFRCMNIDPANPHWEDRDRFVMSKGHSCLVQYAALAELGFFPKDELWHAKEVGSILQGHPDMKKTPGVDATRGSLGNGLSFALGIALALKYQKKTAQVYALIGDGDAQEGMIWEAAMLAGARRTDNLIAILDYNHLQGSGVVEDIIPMEPLADKWASFGWNVLQVNGHNMSDVVDRLEMARDYHGRPTVIIAHTVKGKGVSFMENNNKWHASPVTPEEYQQAAAELDAQMAALQAEA